MIVSPSCAVLAGDWILYKLVFCYTAKLKQGETGSRLGMCVIELYRMGWKGIVADYVNSIQSLPDFSWWKIETIEMGSKFWQRDRNCYFWNGPFAMFDMYLKQFRPTNGNVVSVCFPTLDLTVNRKKGLLVQTKCCPAPRLVFGSIISRYLGKGCNMGQSFPCITSVREICEICSFRTF